MADMRDEAGLGETYDPVPEPGQAPARTLDEETLEGTVDLTPPLDPEDFDFDAFLAGARPFRRSVRLFMRADLIAELDELAAAVQAAKGNEDKTAALVARFDETKAAFYASGRWFVIEGRSAEWVELQRKELVKEFGLSLKKDGSVGDGARRDEALEAMTHELLLRQIVTPSRGITRDNLAKLAERSPGEYRKLLVTQAYVNSNLAEKSGVLGVDFSQAPSAAAAGS